MVEINHQILIKESPRKVFEALATEAGLRQWWTADSSAEERVGGKAEFGFDNRGTVFRMKIEELQPGSKVVWRCYGDHPEWDGTLLTWALTPQGDGTMLRFTHSGWESLSDFCVMCNSTWGELVYRLRNHVEGRNPGPLWDH